MAAAKKRKRKTGTRTRTPNAGLTDVFKQKNFTGTFMKGGKVVLGLMTGVTIRGIMDKALKPDPAKQGMEYLKDGAVFAGGVALSTLSKDETVRLVGVGVASAGMIKSYERALDKSVLKGFEGFTEGIMGMMGGDSLESNTEDVDFEEISGLALGNAFDDTDSEEPEVTGKQEPARQFNISGTIEDAEEIVSGTSDEYDEYELAA